jgi:uncharacterized glyoxalase superfamily protein PhnB
MTSLDDSGLFGCRPVLCVESVPHSIAYYVDRLGFRLGLTWSGDEQRFLPAGETAGATFAFVGHGLVQLMLSERSQGAPGMWLHLDVHTAKQLDALHEEWTRNGATILEPPSLRPWGMVEMRVRDLDGHVLRISAPPPAEKIS